MDRLEYWKKKLDAVNEEILNTLFLERERLSFLTGRKQFLEFAYNKTLEDRK